MSYGVFDDGWDRDPSYESASTPHESAWEPADREPVSAGSSYVSMELDNGLLPVRLQFSADWSEQIAPGEAGRELFRAYEDAVLRSVARNIDAGRGRHAYACSTPRRKQLELLLDSATREQYQEILRLIGSFGNYVADGPTTEYGDPVLTIRADRFSIKSFIVVPQWATHADSWALENEILGCVETLREMRPKFVVRGDYERYTDGELEAWNQQHYQQLIEQRRVS